MGEFIIVEIDWVEALGLNEAIFTRKLLGWLNWEGAYEDSHGQRWVYNTHAEWLRQLPWLSKSTLQRVIGRLRERGVVLAFSRNAHNGDHTLWYSVDVERLNQLVGESMVNLTTSVWSKRPQGDTKMTTSTSYKDYPPHYPEGEEDYAEAEEEEA
jgi:hypothetical protein